MHLTVFEEVLQNGLNRCKDDAKRQRAGDGRKEVYFDGWGEGERQLAEKMCQKRVEREARRVGESKRAANKLELAIIGR